MRRFLFLRDPYAKTYLTFFTGITEWEIHAHIYSVCFRLRKTSFYTYCYRAYGEQLENNFTELREVYHKTIFIYNNLFHFLHMYFVLRNKKVSLDPKFAELLEQNAQNRSPRVIYLALQTFDLLGLDPSFFSLTQTPYPNGQVYFPLSTLQVKFSHQIQQNQTKSTV